MLYGESEYDVMKNITTMIKNENKNIWCALWV